jgi:hypothetical protein
MTAAEMKHMRKTAGYSGTDYKTNRDCKRTKCNPSLAENTEIQKILVATYKQNAP